MKYGYNKKINLPFTETVRRVKEALAKESFGVLTEIDVKATLRKKLGVDYSSYVVLGACNPSFAYRALQAEKEVGLLLPCNVIVYGADHEVTVSAILPSVAMAAVENSALKDIAHAVEEKLKKVVDSA